ncbi:MAG: hypothetical protein HRT35_11565 [Algicola sp.]|nr:hypothetical protein [Algicola sp.]
MNTAFQQVHGMDLTVVEREFEGWHISSFKVSIGRGHIVAYCCQTTNSADFANEWQQINSYIAAKYVAKNKQPFERWNSYLLFVCTAKIPKALRYEIENNKFAMRKIVVGEAGTVLNDEALAIVLNREILSTNVTITSNSNTTFPPLILNNVTTDLIAANLQPGRGSAQENRKKWLDMARFTTRQLVERQDGKDEN